MNFKKIVGKRIKYTGTNGNEYDEVCHGLFVKGEGICIEHYGSHILVKHDDDTVICVDPLSVEIIK
jgi:regulator of replication initiation timing